MKNFLKLQLPWVLFEVVILSFLLLLIWLDGYRNRMIFLYGGMLILIATAVFLLIQFYRERTFYAYLAQKDLDHPTSGALSRQWCKRHEAEKSKWLQEMRALESRHQQHIQFMDLWVHQMKTPISVLELMAEIEEIEVYDLLEETDRLKSGLNQALTYSRLDDFTEDFVIAPISVTELVNRAISTQKRSFIRKNVYPKITGEDIRIFSDEKWLGIVLHQVISNAIKYSEPKSQLDFVICPQEHMLKIRDYGCGILATDLPRVFRPFFTGENGRKYGEATGMGLYLAQTICQRLAIQLQIDSTVDVGTEVCLIFSFAEEV